MELVSTEPAASVPTVTPFEPPSLMRLILYAVMLGTVLFLVNYAGVIAGITDPPAGHVPLYMIRNLDVPQYMAWITLARDQFLLPNVHAPWITDAAMFQPIMVIIARIGAVLHTSPIATYYLVHLLLYWIGSFALLQAAWTFCTSQRQVIAAVVIAACAVPVQLIGWAALPITHLPPGLFVMGLLQYGYDSADGLFRGGLSNSPTLTLGTAMVLFSFTFLARYLENGRTPDFYRVLACNFLSAVLHPFEVFLLAPASAILLISRREWSRVALVAVAAGLGLSPFTIQTIRTPWLLDVSDLAQWHGYFLLWIPAVFGIPAILTIYLLALRFRMPRAGDHVLQTWFLTMAVLPLVPFVPFALHAFDGFAYCVALLLVRRVSIDKQLRGLRTSHPRLVRSAAAVLATVTLLTLFTFYRQVYQDGRSAAPEVLLSTVGTPAELEMVDWIRAHIPRETLILSPTELSPLVAMAPTHSFASQDVFGITFEEQRLQAEAFFAGKGSLVELVARYGMRYVIVPSQSPALEQLRTYPVRHESGDLRLYEVPSGGMKPYTPVPQAAGKPKNLRRRLAELFQ